MLIKLLTALILAIALIVVTLSVWAERHNKEI